MPTALLPARPRRQNRPAADATPLSFEAALEILVGPPADVRQATLFFLLVNETHMT